MFNFHISINVSVNQLNYSIDVCCLYTMKNSCKPPFSVGYLAVVLAPDANLLGGPPLY